MCKPVAQPPDLSLGFKNLSIQVDRSVGDWAFVPVRAPVDQFRFGYRETHSQGGPLGLQPRILCLEDLDVASVQRQGCCQTEVVNVGEHNTWGDLEL